MNLEAQTKHPASLLTRKKKKKHITPLECETKY